MFGITHQFQYCADGLGIIIVGYHTNYNVGVYNVFEMKENVCKMAQAILDFMRTLQKSCVYECYAGCMVGYVAVCLWSAVQSNCRCSIIKSVWTENESIICLFSHG